MEQIFFLVLVAVVGLVRWFLQAAENKKNVETQERPDAPQREKSTGQSPAQSEEERIRKFFEALGVPASAAPPARKAARQVTPKPRRAPRTILPVDPFPMSQKGGLPPVVDTPPPFVASAPQIDPETPPPLPRVAAPSPTRVSPTARTERVPARFEVRDIDQGAIEEFPQPIAPPAESGPGQELVSWRAGIARLATPEGRREVIILTEIFGPPRSMRPVIHEVVG